MKPQSVNPQGTCPGRTRAGKGGRASRPAGEAAGHRDSAVVAGLPGAQGRGGGLAQAGDGAAGTVKAQAGGAPGRARGGSPRGPALRALRGQSRRPPPPRAGLLAGDAAVAPPGAAPSPDAAGTAPGTSQPRLGGRGARGTTAVLPPRAPPRDCSRGRGAGVALLVLRRPARARGGEAGKAGVWVRGLHS